MGFSFSTALSGLRANSAALSVTGNNIANANTTAFKSSTINFADVYTNSLSARFNGAGLALQIGSGVRISGASPNFNQGSLNESGSPLNAGIQGNGLFVAQSPSGAQAYTRAGDFALDRNGYLVTPSGHRIQGYAAVNGAIPTDATLTAIRVPIGEIAAPVITTQATFRLNLNATDLATSQFHAPVQVYDSKGVSHTLDLVFTKQADGSYQVTATLDGNAAQLSVDGGAAQATPAAMTFSSNGLLATPNSLAVLPDQTLLNGATLPSININLRQTNPDGTPGAPNITNYNSPSAVASTDQDGFPSGLLTGISFSSDLSGVLTAVFSNGQTRTIAQVAVATFNSQNGLRRLGDNLYGETLSSGPPSIGIAGTGGRGEVVGGVLEQSNVDIATEFTDLILAQRGFQANSRVITTVNQTLQDLLQII